MKKILFLMADGFDTPTSINQLIETLLCDILDKGISVHMVAGRKGGDLPDVPSSLLERSGFSCDIVDRGKIDKTNFIQRFFYDLAYVSKAKQLWKHTVNDVDCVLMQSTHLGFFHVSALKKLFKGPVVYNLYDIFPDNVKNVTGKIPYKVLDCLQRRLYALCDKIVVISEDMKSTLANKGVDVEKMCVVPIWHDDGIAPVSNERNPFIKRYSIDCSKFIVQFAGSFGYVFDYETVLRIAERLRGYEDIEFHMIGQGTRLEEFICKAEEKRLSSIKFFPWQPADELASVYSSCSIGLIPLEKDVIFNAYPSKTSLLMACGKPSVFSIEKKSEFAQMIEKKRIGFVAQRGNDAECAEAILKFFNDNELLCAYSNNARHFAKDELDRTTQTKRFIEVLVEAGELR